MIDCSSQFRKKILVFFGALLLLGFFNGNSVLAKKIKIEDINLKGSILSIQHDSFGDLKFKRRVYDNPPRLVFDLLDAELGNKVVRYDLPAGLGVSKARIAQFDEDTTRVVVEGDSLTALEKVYIENIGQNIYFKFDVKNVKIQDFVFEEGDLRVVADGILIPRTILLDKPERLVLDLIGAELKSSSQKKKIKNGEETIKISQFDDAIVRIVFDGDKSHGREVRISNNEKQLLILGKDRREEEEYEELERILSMKLLRKSDNESLFQIESLDKKLEYNFLKLHNPERLVVDLIGIEFDDSLGSEQIPETEQVSDVRFGLATLGKPVTRIVFDLKSKELIEEFKETSGGHSLIIKLVGHADDDKKKKDEEKDEDDDIEPAVKSAGTKVVIDPGHGGYDHGAIYGNHDEKDITLSISRKVNEYLDAAGIKAFMTRSEDRFVSLAERVEVSNAIDPRIFVSIHVNALVTNPELDGLQTYYYSRNGYKLGSVLHKQLLGDVKMTDGKLRKANFWVTKYTKAPSVLLELGFMTNIAERKKLVKESYQNDLAKAIARGIIAYLEGAR